MFIDVEFYDIFDYKSDINAGISLQKNRRFYDKVYINYKKSGGSKLSDFFVKFTKNSIFGAQITSTKQN